MSEQLVRLDVDSRKEALEYSIRHLRNPTPTNGFKEQVASILEWMLVEAKP